MALGFIHSELNNVENVVYVARILYKDLITNHDSMLSINAMPIVARGMCDISLIEPKLHIILR